MAQGDNIGVPISTNTTLAENSDQIAPSQKATKTYADTKIASSSKNTSNGVAGLTLLKINFLNVLGTFTSFFTNSNTASRTYIFPDADMNVVGDTTTQTLTNKTFVAPTLGVASGTSLGLNGTAGAGFLELPNQSSNPSNPASGFKRFFPDGNGRLINLASNGQISKYVVILGIDITSSSVLTGTTSNTILKSILIKGGTIQVGDRISIVNRAIRDTATGISSNRLYVNTSSSLSGATALGVQSGANAFYGMQRDLYIKSTTNSETLDTSTTSSGSESSIQTTGVSSLNIDWTVDQYIIHAFQPAASGNSTYSSGLIITRF